LSSRGTCSSATASAGSARRMPDEKRILVLWERRCRVELRKLQVVRLRSSAW
jgi:hypothetical protein